MKTPRSMAAAALVLAAWSPADSAGQGPAAAVPAQPDISVVTVLGRAPARATPEMRRLNRSSASSCAYSATSFQDELIDSYLDSFQGRDRTNDGTEMAVPVEGDPVRNGGFRDTSPYGDASRSGPLIAAPDAGGRSDPCTQSAYNEAAARNQIARKDKTLDQAYAAYDRGDYAHALALFQTSYSKVGWDDAALMLGAMYEAGQGTARDSKEAIAWYTKLAQARLVKQHYSIFNPAAPELATPRIEAQLRLAQLYLDGGDVPRDPARARFWYKQAADLEHVPSRYALGRMLQSGYGGARDLAGAPKLYTEAAEVGYAPAQIALAGLYRSGQGVAKDPQKAFAWYREAALNARPGVRKMQAQYAVAQAYDEGVGVAADPARALTFYKLAAVAGHPAAQNALATYFYNGQVVAKDLPLARKLFLSAAAQGQDGAMVNAAAMLYRGEGGGRDAVQALAWLKLGAKLGNEQAANGAAALEKELTPEQRARANAAVKGGK